MGIIFLYDKNNFPYVLSDDIIKESVEEKYVKSFTFYAVKSGKAYAELEVSIDWEEHERQIDRGNIIIKAKTPDGVLAQLIQCEYKVSTSLNLSRKFLC